MTLEGWVRPSALGSTWRTVVLKERAPGLAYSLYANRNTSVPSGQAYIGGATREANGAGGLPLNSWTHLAATYDATTLRLYVNGFQVASTLAPGVITTSGGPLRIGGNAIWSEWFQGLSTRSGSTTAR